MPNRKLVMLYVSAIDYGTHYAIINRNGRRTSRLKHDDTGPMSKNEVKRLKRRIGWNRLAVKMMTSLNNKARRKQRTEWDVKIATWQQSIWLREKHHSRTRVGRRFFSDETRPNWERSYECMLRQYYNKVVRKNRHRTDPWALWTETVSRNHNRKEQRSESRTDP